MNTRYDAWKIHEGHIHYIIFFRDNKDNDLQKNMHFG